MMNSLKRLLLIYLSMKKSFEYSNHSPWPLDKMFDGNLDTEFHGVHGENNGVQFKLKQRVLFKKLKFNTRKDCCFVRCKDVCVVNEKNEELSCFSADKVNHGQDKGLQTAKNIKPIRV